MKENRPALRAMQDLTHTTIPEAMLEMGARVMALASLGVTKGIWTEEEFIAAQFRAQRVLDEEQAKNQVVYRRKEKLMLAEQLRMIRDVMFKWCMNQWNDRDAFMLDALRQPLEAEELQHWQPGIVWLRIISEHFKGSIEDRVQLLGIFIRNELGNVPDFRESQINVIPVTPAEQAASPASQTFDALLAHQVAAGAHQCEDATDDLAGDSC